MPTGSSGRQLTLKAWPGGSLSAKDEAEDRLATRQPLETPGKNTWVPVPVQPDGWLVYKLKLLGTKGTSAEKMPPSDWPVGKSTGGIFCFNDRGGPAKPAVGGATHRGG